MKLLLAGPIQGNLTKFYENVPKDTRWVICAGDFGIWVDPARMDRASKLHVNTEFARYYVGVDGLSIPVPTLTIAGVRDDNRWLEERRTSNNLEVLKRVHWLAQGYRTVVGFDVPIRVTGLGRAYSEDTYNGKPSKKAHRQYTRHDVERACSSGPTDLLVVYEHLDAPGVRNVIFATRPKLILQCYQQNRKVYDEVQNTPVITLDRDETRLIEWRDNSFIV